MSLRDALLKAGKVNKQQAQEAATANRKKAKQKGGGHALEAEMRSASEVLDAERRAAQAAENKAREEAKRLEREEHERRVRLGNLIAAWGRRPSPRASRPWHFVRSNGRIGRILVDRQVADELEFGAVGIVELPNRPDELRIVSAEGVRKLLEAGAPVVRFYVGRDAPDDPLVNPPRRRIDPD